MKSGIRFKAAIRAASLLAAISLAACGGGGGGGSSGSSSGSSSGGSSSGGAPAATLKILYSFTGSSTANGPPAEPAAALVLGSDGNFYGTTQNGGAAGSGTVFKITPAGVETTLYSFNSIPDGQTPSGGLIQGPDGNFYGTTGIGGVNGVGTVYRISPTGVESVLYSFSGLNGDGSDPETTLILGHDGNFYGTTYGGGTNGNGTVFKITPAGLETVLYAFTGSSGDGSGPGSALMLGSDGNFYGTTVAGGANNAGTVFRITPAGLETVLYSFPGSTSFDFPVSSALIQASDGNFYGTTFYGGANGNGTVFKITPAGVETTLHSFGTNGDGKNPYSALIQGSDGNFYGTTAGGTIASGGTGNQIAGTVFKITPAGVESVLYSFTGLNGDGDDPLAALVLGSDGNFYGTTLLGGTSFAGTVFKITP